MVLYSRKGEVNSLSTLKTEYRKRVYQSMEYHKRIASELEKLEQEEVRLSAIQSILEHIEYNVKYHEEHWESEQSESMKKYHADRYNAYRKIFEDVESMI